MIFLMILVLFLLNICYRDNFVDQYINDDIILDNIGEDLVNGIDIYS